MIRGSDIPPQPTDPILLSAQKSLQYAKKFHPDDHPGVVKLTNLVRILKDPVFQQIYRVNKELDPYFQDLAGRYIDPSSGQYRVSFKKQRGGDLGFSISREMTGGDVTFFVDSVMPNGVAFFKGVREGDIFLRVNNMKITSPEMFQEEMNNFESTGSIEFTLARKVVFGEEKTLTVQEQTEVILLENKGVGFGFAIVVVGEEVRVEKIVAGSSAAVDGRLRRGDRLIAIGKTPTAGLDSSSVVSELKSAGRLVSLTIWREVPLDYPIRYDDCNQMFHISVTKLHNQSLGINISDVKDIQTDEHLENGLFIKDIVRNSVAEKTGKLQSLDQIVAVNGRTITHLPKQIALPIMKNSGNVLHLTILRRRNISFKEAPDLVDETKDEKLRRYEQELGSEYDVFRCDCPGDALIEMIRPFEEDNDLRYRIQEKPSNNLVGIEFELGDEILEIDGDRVINDEDLLSKLQDDTDTFYRVIYARKANNEYSSVKRDNKRQPIVENDAFQISNLLSSKAKFNPTLTRDSSSASEKIQLREANQTEMTLPRTAFTRQMTEPYYEPYMEANESQDSGTLTNGSGENSQMRSTETLIRGTPESPAKWRRVGRVGDQVLTSPESSLGHTRPPRKEVSTNKMFYQAPKVHHDSEEELIMPEKVPEKEKSHNLRREFIIGRSRTPERKKSSSHSLRDQRLSLEPPVEPANQNSNAMFIKAATHSPDRKFEVQIKGDTRQNTLNSQDESNHEYDEFRMSKMTEYAPTLEKKEIELFGSEADEQTEYSDASEPVFYDSEDWESAKKYCSLLKSEKGFGMNISQLSDRAGCPIVIVDSLLPGGAADQSGVVAEKDRIVSVENFDTSTMSARDLADLMSGIPHGPVKIGFQAYRFNEPLMSDMEPEPYKSTDVSKDEFTVDSSESGTVSRTRTSAATSTTYQTVTTFTTENSSSTTDKTNSKSDLSRSKSDAVSERTMVNESQDDLPLERNISHPSQQSPVPDEPIVRVPKPAFSTREVALSVPKDEEKSEKEDEPELPPLVWTDAMFQEITVLKEPAQSLGIMLQKPKDDSTIGMLIKSTQQGGLIDSDGRLQTGDSLVGVNGNSLIGLSISNARAVLKTVCANCTEIKLLFVAREDAEYFLQNRKPPQRLALRGNPDAAFHPEEALGEESDDGRSKTSSAELAEPSFDNVEFGTKRYVSIERVEGQSLGLSIVDYSIGIIVSDVLAGSPADNSKEGKIQPWDRIVSVNGTDVTQASRLDAIRVIQSARSPLMFVVQQIIFPDSDSESNKTQNI